MSSFSLQQNVVGAGGSETAGAHNEGITGQLLQQPFAAFQRGLNKDDDADVCQWRQIPAVTLEHRHTIDAAV